MMNENGERLNKDQNLPEYLAGRLNSRESGEIEDWLERSQDAVEELRTWKNVQRLVDSQPWVQPPPSTWLKIHDQIESAKPKNPFWYRFALQSAVITLALLSVFWFLIKPGYALQWSVPAGEAQLFEVYRAPVGSNEFVRVATLEAQTGRQEYRYVDYMVIPGRAYVYRIDGIGGEGLSAISQPLTSDPLSALPGQLAIVISSLVLGFVIFYVLRLENHRFPIWNSLLIN